MSACVSVCVEVCGIIINASQCQVLWDKIKKESSMYFIPAINEDPEDMWAPCKMTGRGHCG